MADSPSVLEVEGLTKSYRNTLAVDGLSFALAPGEIFGLIGANGAGKTTAISMVLGLVTPTGGRIRIFGLDPEKHRRKVLARMNFSSPYVALPQRLTVLENLRVYADLYGVPHPRARIDALCRQFDITDLRHKRYGQLSSGQKTRVSMAKALLNDPGLLLLDEPTASLDPEVAESIRGYLLSYRETRKAAIVVSSHNMQEVERVCDRLLILKQGKTVAQGSPREVLARYGSTDLETLFIAIMRKGQA